MGSEMCIRDSSTGSFGFVRAVGDVAGTRIVAYSNYGGAGFETSLRENKLLFGYNGDEDAYGEINMGASYMDFKASSGANPLLRVHKSDGTIEALSGNISGSATSTGSFGRMEIDEFSSTGGSGNIFIKTSASSNNLKIDPANVAIYSNTIGMYLGANNGNNLIVIGPGSGCLLYTSPSPRDLSTSRMPSSA